MASNPWVNLIVALLGSGGLGAVVIAIFNNIHLHKQGVAGKEDQRRVDIVQQRDDALAHAKMAEEQERAEEARADAERELRIKWREEAARLRIELINAGRDPGDSLLDDTRPPRPKE